MILRPYQKKLYDDINNAWLLGYQNVLAVAQTGAGKSVLLSEVLKNHVGQCAVMAHTTELISQLSMLLAHRGIHHDIIAPRAAISDICKMHVVEYGVCYFRPESDVFVISAPTMVRRLDADYSNVTLWICDEAQHLLKAPGMWGKCVEAFGQAKGLGVTATPHRSDGKGLSRVTDSYFDILVEGPSVQYLISEGYLSEFEMYAPESLQTDDISITSSGEFNQKQLTERAEQSTITGDVVREYLRLGFGRQGITFCVNVEMAYETAEAYRKAGVTAEVITAKTPASERFQIMREFRAGNYRQICNVNTLTEGVDIPQVGVVSLARPTASLGLIRQMIGRVLRVSGDKRKATIIDHGGNLLRHGSPDLQIPWSLDRRSRKSQKPDDLLAVTTCVNCMAVYERLSGRTCPYCNYTSVPDARSLPEHVDGDLTLLTPEILAQLRGEVDEANRTADDIYKEAREFQQSDVICHTRRKRQQELLDVRGELTEAIRRWGQVRRDRRQADDKSYREFFLSYGVDVLTAQTLNKKDTENLIKGVDIKIQWSYC